MCASDMAVLFHGKEAGVFKPTDPTITIDGTPILKGHLDEQTELYMVDIHGGHPMQLQGGTHPTGPNQQPQTEPPIRPVALPLEQYQHSSITIT